MRHFLIISVTLIWFVCFVFTIRPKYDQCLVNNGGNSNCAFCGQILDQLKAGQQGFIQSPNYPNNYPPNLECTWNLNATNNTKVYLTIFDLDISSGHDLKDTDSLSVSLTGNWNQAQRYSGDLTTLTPINLVTESNQLILRFVTNSVHFLSVGQVHRGFRIAYQVRDISNQEFVDKIVVDACLTPRNKNINQLQVPVNVCSNEPNEMQAITRVNPTPYLVGLILDENEFCAGALVSKQHVMTTAHCTSGVEKIELIFGTENLRINDVGVQRREQNSSAVYSHPNFSPNTGLNDISIIELSQPIEITRFVKQIELPTWKSLSTGFVGVDSQVSGWKETEDSISDIATKSEFVIEPNAACRGSLDKSLSGMMLCLKPAAVEHCTANSGSPVATRCKYPTNQEEEEAVTPSFESTITGGEPEPEEESPPEQTLTRQRRRLESEWIELNPAKSNKENKYDENDDQIIRQNSTNQEIIDHGWTNLKENEEEDEDDFDDYIHEEKPYTNNYHEDCMNNNNNEFTGNNILLGLKSFGNCKNGFAFTKLTAHLDFINKILFV